jgi:hypothetical protein
VIKNTKKQSQKEQEIIKNLCGSAALRDQKNKT